ncbi:Ribonuclease H protein [Rutstroemia sp. NJR-2017a BBW]|nr:Ribonuclease H protein [Rutstroemia sp. NJR-2017a BBW]
MRKAKIGLRQLLYLRKVPDVDNDKCECRRGSQTVRHILFSCPLYYELRQETWGERTRDQQDLRKVLGAPDPALKAAKFMRNTGLLGLCTGNHLGDSEPKLGLKWGSEVEGMRCWNRDSQSRGSKWSVNTNSYWWLGDHAPTTMPHERPSVAGIGL